ncbi:MAG: CAP domain-containing protein [Gaiellales bacterium]
MIALVAAAGVLTIAAVPAQGASQPRWMGLYRAINKVRANHGLHPIVISTRLHLAARRHSHDMLWRGYFAHTSPTGSTLTQRVMGSGFITYGQWWAGETLAWGSGSYGDPSGVVQAWLKSPEHRAIMLSSRYHLAGIGRAYGTFLGHPGASVWTVDWGHR